MDHWPSARWKIGLITAGAERWVEPSLPFAFIGAHPICEGLIEAGLKHSKRAFYSPPPEKAYRGLDLG